jgi:ribosomal protein S18 acetylase RimI-like enzyme
MGNEHPVLPDYTFSKITTDRTPWYTAISEANEFGISVEGLRHDLMFCMIAGYMVLGEDKRIIATNCLANRGGFLNVLYLWVAEPYRRQHIGENLVNLAILRAKKNGYYNLYTSVQDTRTPAIELFKKLDFKETE